MEPSVLAVVTNHDFSDSADDLKARLAPHYETLLVDSGSPTAPRTADIVLPNRYYCGLWNEAVRLALERRKPWLLFVASDVQVPDTARLCGCVRDALGTRSMGIYTPALRADSRAFFPACVCRGTGRLRECFVCEGFCFLARTELLSAQYPVDPGPNRYGWGLDVMQCRQAYRAGYRVFVDDRIAVYHPAAIHPIPVEEARRQQYRYMGDEGIRFLDWANHRLAAQGRCRELPLQWAMRASQWVRRNTGYRARRRA